MSYSKASKPTHIGKRQLKSPTLGPKPPGEFLDGCVQEPKRKRVWKACERCKVKKIKCDAATPCRRCKDDGMICVTKSRRIREFASVPRRYAEVLENTHFSLVATVEKLYSMLRNGESWLLDDPQTNEDGTPIIHDIAKLLGCLKETQDNLWSIPDPQDRGRKVVLPKQEQMEGSQQSFSPDSYSSPHFEELGYLSQDSESIFRAVDQERVVHQDQQEYCSMWSLLQENPLPAYEEPLEAHDALPPVPMQDTEVNYPNQYPCQTDSTWNIFSAISSFDAVNATYILPPELSLDVLDMTMWSDELAWKLFTDT